MPPIDPRLPAPRFYCATLPHPRLGEPYCTLNAEQTRHARKVLRVQVGQAVELFDGHGRLARATVADYQSDTTLCQVNEVEVFDQQRPLVTVAAAVPKGGRGDDMVNQLSQIGADRFIPIRTERSVVDPREAKLERYTAAAVESAKQSRRLFLMQIETVQDFEDVLTLGRDLALIATPEGQAIDGLGQKLIKAEHVMLFIGPEGGFTENEMERAMEAGCLAWRIAGHILRIETAAVAAVAIARYLAQGASQREQR